MYLRINPQMVGFNHPTSNINFDQSCKVHVHYNFANHTPTDADASDLYVIHDYYC